MISRHTMLLARKSDTPNPELIKFLAFNIPKAKRSIFNDSKIIKKRTIIRKPNSKKKVKFVFISQNIVKKFDKTKNPQLSLRV